MIRNFGDLAVTEQREHALRIAEAGLEAINTEHVIRRAVRLTPDTLNAGGDSIPLASIKNIYVAAIGKCALDAARTLEEILGERITDGMVIDVRSGKLERIRVRQGDHPMPSERNVNATREMIQMLQEAGVDDLVLFVISGGGSTLLCQPRDLGFAKEAKVLHVLFEKGATIHEINILRKHLSLARGGFLAQYAHPARSAALIFSDVPGDEVEIISSGPTVPDASTIRDAQEVLRKYDIAAICGLRPDQLMETPKDPEIFRRVSNHLVVSNQDALRAMANKAEELGLAPKIVETRFMGEAEALGRSMVEAAAREQGHSVLLYGGESTVKILGKGKGGRNQTLALAGLPALRLNQLVLALASDGRDNTDFAGALCDAITRKKAECLGLDPSKYLNENDTYHFFEKVGDSLVTGNTGSNVSDLVMVINE